MADQSNLAALPLDEFLKVVTGAPVTNQEPRGTLPSAVPPQTAAALADMSKALGVKVPDDYVSPEGKDLGIRPGVFLDTSTGASAWDRFKLGLDENTLNQFNTLARKYGSANVDFSPEGRLILRNQKDDTGHPVDILVDPHGADSGDAAQMAGGALPIIGGILGARFGGSLMRKSGPIIRTLSGVTGMAVGQEATGGLQDLAVRYSRGDNADVGPIAKQRLKMAAADEAIGIAAVGASKIGTKLLEGAAGLLGVETGSTATQQAQRELQSRTGVKFPLSPGQAAESPLFMRGEAIASGRPGTAGSMDRILAAQQKAEDELRRVYLGLPRTMSDEDLATVLPRADETGNRALRVLGDEAGRLKWNVSAAVGDIQQTGTAEAQIRAGVDLDHPLNVTDVGQSLRSRATTEFQAFRSKMGQRYEDFLSKPEVRDRTVSGATLSKSAADIEQAMTPQAATTKSAVDYDAYGSPIERTTSSTDRLDSFIPGKVKAFIDELKSLSGAKVSVNDLKQIRTSIDNAIAEGVAIPGTDIAQLKALRGAVDSNISTALQDINPSLLSEWNILKSDYSSGMQRFDKNPIRQMLIKEGETGSIGNTSLAERIMGNSGDALDHYNAYKEFFGASSPEFKAVQQAAREKTLRGPVIDELGGYLKGATLSSRLTGLRPEIASELFGADQTELHRIGAILDQAGARNIDTEELAKLAQGGNSVTASKVQALIDAEGERSAAFNNRLIKAAANGTLDAEKIRPSDFVRYAADMDPDSAARVMGILASKPNLVRDIHQLAVEDVLSRVQAGQPGAEFTSSTLIKRVLGESRAGRAADAQERTWRVLMGDDTVDNLKKFAEMADSREFAVKKFSSGGTLAGSSDIAKMVMSPESSEIRKLAWRFTLGTLYTGPLKQAITNLITSNDRSRFLNSVITSTPFLESLVQRFKGDGAFAIVHGLRDSLEPIQRKEMVINGATSPDQAGVDVSKLSEAEFMQWIKNASQIDLSKAPPKQ